MIFRPRIAAEAPYGAFELKSWYQPNLASAMLLVALAVGSIWLGLWIYQRSQMESSMVVVDQPPAEVDSRHWTDITPGDRPGGELPKVTPPKAGIPVAVFDADYDSLESNQLPTKDELGAIDVAGIDFGSEGADGLTAVQLEYFPSPDDFTPVEKRAEFVQREIPRYPELARKAGAQGVVFLKVLVDKQGRPAAVIVAKESGCNCGFEEAAVDAAWKSVFSPGIQNGQPIAMWVAYPVKFQIR